MQKKIVFVNEFYWRTRVKYFAAGVVSITGDIEFSFVI